MVFTPYDTMDRMLEDVDKAVTLKDGHPEQQNAVLNRFKYRQYTSPEHQAIIVKEFNELSFNGPATHDFIVRLNIIFDSIIDYCKPNSEQLKQLEEAKDAAIHLLNTHCQIKYLPDHSASRSENGNTGVLITNPHDLSSNEKKLVKIIIKAKGYLQKFIVDALQIVAPATLENKTFLVPALEGIANSESALTARRGRENFINYYPVTVPHQNTVQRVSINRVTGHAIPSTERLSAKLPNFVECGVGYMEGNQYISQFKGYRHSSYTPIKMIDKTYGDSNYKLLFGHREQMLSAVNRVKFERRRNASLCAREMFVELARQQILKGADPKAVIPVRLSSLALLSPVKGDKLFMRRGESEHRQLKESYNALMMYNHREIELEVDGKKVRVKPAITIINTPSNWHGIKLSRYMPSTLERNINAEGMNTFITNTEAYLKPLNLDYLADNDAIQEYRKQQASAQKELADLYIKLDMILNPQASFTSSHTGFFSKSINTPPMNASADPDYLALLKKIESTRLAVQRFERKIFKERTQMLKKKRARIQLYLKTLYDKKNKTKHEEVAELYYSTLFMGLDKQLEPAQLGARYLLANEKMGNFVDFYCKSGEDRTGRMQNLIEELCEFFRETGHFPRYDFDRQRLDKTDAARQLALAKIVSERSVSRDNTNANALGARGLQITSSLELNTGLANHSGSKMGTLAKTVYDSLAIGKLARALGFGKTVDKDATLSASMRSK